LWNDQRNRQSTRWMQMVLRERATVRTSPTLLSFTFQLYITVHGSFSLPDWLVAPSQGHSLHYTPISSLEDDIRYLANCFLHSKLQTLISIFIPRFSYNFSTARKQNKEWLLVSAKFFCSCTSSTWYHRYCWWWSDAKAISSQLKLLGEPSVVQIVIIRYKNKDPTNFRFMRSRAIVAAEILRHFLWWRRITRHYIPSLLATM
jgi:hypothetical protein